MSTIVEFLSSVMLSFLWIGCVRNLPPRIAGGSIVAIGRRADAGAIGDKRNNIANIMHVEQSLVAALAFAMKKRITSWEIVFRPCSWWMIIRSCANGSPI
jgi:hypothetical protein